MQQRYDSLRIEPRADGVLLVSIPARQPGQTPNRQLHEELGGVWRDIAEDPEVRVAVLTGEGSTFMPSVDVDTHAAILWPLLCGLAKAKYHILTSTPITGAEAERIGLISLTVDDSDVLEVALDIASGLAQGPQHALRWTKRVLNHWVRDAAPIFEASLAYEAVGFFGDEHVEALRAIRDERPPAFAASVHW